MVTLRDSEFTTYAKVLYLEDYIKGTDDAYYLETFFSNEIGALKILDRMYKGEHPLGLENVPIQTIHKKETIKAEPKVEGAIGEEKTEEQMSPDNNSDDDDPPSSLDCTVL